MHLFVDGCKFGIQGVQFGIERFARLIRDLAGYGCDHLVDLFKLFGELTLRLAEFFKLLGDFTERLGGFGETAHGCIQIYNTLSNSHGQCIELDDVLAHARGYGKEGTHRDQNENQHAPQDQPGVLQASFLALVDALHHFLQVTAHVCSH